MPPWPNIITAITLALLVVVSMPLTLGFAILAWYWLFEAAASILAIAGVFKVASGLGAPRWIGVALAAPAIVWALNRLSDMTRVAGSLDIFFVFNLASALALFSAGAAALSLVEMISNGKVFYRVGYGILAVAALIAVNALFAHEIGWDFTNNALYRASTLALRALADVVIYGAIIIASIIIRRKHNLEYWISVTLCSISIFFMYTTISALLQVSFAGQGDGLAFWLRPVILLVGGAAVWRMGSILCVQRHPDQPLPT